MEAAAVCVFLLLRFVAASASASVAFYRVRLVIRHLPPPPPSPPLLPLPTLPLPAAAKALHLAPTKRLLKKRHEMRNVTNTIEKIPIKKCF